MGRLRLPDIALLVALGLDAMPAISAQAIDVGHREVLPDTVVPTHYDLALSPDAEALTFSGTVAIKIPVTEELIQRSPNEIAENGMMNSATAKAHTAALCALKVRSAPRCQAIGSRISVPSATRPQATTNGDSS